MPERDMPGQPLDPLTHWLAGGPCPPWSAGGCAHEWQATQPPTYTRTHHSADLTGSHRPLRVHLYQTETSADPDRPGTPDPLAVVLLAPRDLDLPALEAGAALRQLAADLLNAADHLDHLNTPGA